MMDIKKYDDATLWAILADISEMPVMQNMTKDSDRFMFWYHLCRQVIHELDRRLLDESLV